MLQGIILAGGQGQRFWPLSQPGRPKQLLTLCDDRSLLRTTWNRLRLRLADDAIWVVTGESLVPAVRMELPELLGSRLVPEVVGRNTAPALAVAAALGLRGGANPLQLVVPSDHWIPDGEAFWQSVERAMAVAYADDAPLVTFGIPISCPDTGYGYIERGEQRGAGGVAWQVSRFHEKPDRATATAYQKAGDFFWNSGIFLWQASSLMDEIARTMPELHALVRPLLTAEDHLDLLADIFRQAPEESIDFGVLEKARRVAVVPAAFEWNDVGTWERWARLRAADAARNVAEGDVLSLDCEDCVFYADGGAVAALGVKDLVVVRTEDVTLVVPRTRSHEVRRILRAYRERSERRR